MDIWENITDAYLRAGAYLGREYGIDILEDPEEQRVAETARHDAEVCPGQVSRVPEDFYVRLFSGYLGLLMGCAPEESCRLPANNGSTSSFLSQSSYQPYTFSGSILPSGPTSAVTVYVERGDRTNPQADPQERDLANLAFSQLMGCSRSILEFYGLQTPNYARDIRLFLFQGEEGSSAYNTGEILLTVPHFRRLLNAGVPSSDLRCISGDTAHEAAHWIYIPSVFGDLEPPLESSILEEGLADYLGRRVTENPTTVSIVSQAGIDAISVRLDSLRFSECNEGRYPSVCGQRDRDERWDCCYANYVSAANHSYFDLANGERVNVLLLYVRTPPATPSLPRLFVVLENAHDSSQTTSFFMGTEACVDFSIPPSLQSVCVGPEERGSDINTIQGLRIFFLGDDYRRGLRSEIECGEEGYQAVEQMILGRSLFNLLTWSRAPYRVQVIHRMERGRTFDSIDAVAYHTGSCFWDHLRETYGTESFRRVVLRLQHLREELPGGIEIDVVRMIAETLGRPPLEIESTFRRFRMNPEWFRHRRLSPVCE